MVGLRTNTAAAVLASLALAGTANAQNVTLKMANWVPPVHHLTETYAKWSASVRAASVGRLSSAKSHWAFKGLVYALGDTEPEVVLLAIQGLRSVGDESAIPELMPLLDHGDLQIRAATRKALASLH